MDNLFKDNFTQSQVDTQKALKHNIAFCAKLVRDLDAAFNVSIQNRRSNEDSFETVVSSPSQAGRYGFGFRFTATDQGVTFRDERGVWADSLAKVLNVSIQDEYSATASNLEVLRGAVKSGKVSFQRDSACGDRCSLELTLNEGPDLNSQIKLIIGVLMAHHITTKL